MAQDSDKEFEEKMNRMIFDYLNERKMDKIAKKFSKECGTDMDKKFKRPNLKKEWLNFLKQAEERYVYFDNYIDIIVSHEVERCYPDLRPIFYIFLFSPDSGHDSSGDSSSEEDSNDKTPKLAVGTPRAKSTPAANSKRFFQKTSNIDFCFRSGHDGPDL